MPLKPLISFLVLTACYGCRETPAPVQKVEYMPLENYRFHQPCGRPVFSGDMPGGYYAAFVLTDSLQVADCVSSSGGASGAASIALRSGRDFLLILQGSRPCAFSLDGMELADSVLQIGLRADTAARGVNIWKINGEGVKLIQLMADRLHYAYVPGPQWTGTVPVLKGLYQKEQSAGD
ncbi:hypothetical protein [Chitinophaga alhagiae]|nr:hypothetical protein [Chitinophaga alhagiae]